MIGNFQEYLNKDDAILDVGAGTCNVYEILSKQGYQITALDVENLSFVDHVKPVIYDGTTMPFVDNQFDTALILTVLHHTPEPEKILQEAQRVAKRMILIEDIYSSWLHKYVTYFFDSLLNLEFFGHPHTNKNDQEWKNTFTKFGLKLVDVKYTKSYWVFKHAMYYVEKSHRLSES